MKKVTFCIGILFIFLFIAPSAFAADVPGVTDNEVVIGITQPLSGPAALWGNTALGGKAWSDYVNDQGGIHGRKIKVLLKDDGYNPARALANLQEMKGKVFAVNQLLGTAVVHTCRDFFPDNKIPLINAYGNTRMFADYPKDKLRYIFVAYTDYEDEADFLTKWAFKNLGSRKFALFYQNDDYGKLGWSGVAKALVDLGGKAELVGAVPYEVTERALGAHALKLKESGADTLLIYPTPTHGALILKEAAKIGYRPRVLASFPLGDPIMFKVAGPLWEGVYPASVAHVGLPGFDPEANQAFDILKKYNPKLAGAGFFGLFGAGSMMHLVEGLKRAGRDLTVEKLIRAMESIRNWKAQGGGAPATYGPNRHHGLNGTRLTKAEKGKLIPVTDFIIHQPWF
ncbi:MAG: ABC transporter substrate-binding protein [Desulfobacteraceae bacterium]|jgi:ABC-type branched-subunit amino acid transport system substrate-binding protein